MYVYWIYSGFGLKHTKKDVPKIRMRDTQVQAAIVKCERKENSSAQKKINNEDYDYSCSKCCILLGASNRIRKKY